MDFVLPVGCIRSVIDTDLQADMDTYNAACPDSSSSTPTSAPSPTPPATTVEVKVVSITFDSSLVVKASPPPYDNAISLATYVKVLEKAIKKNLGAAHSSIKITKLGMTPVNSRRLVEAPEDVHVEFTVTDEVDCSSSNDCSNVDVDAEVIRVNTYLQNSIDGGQLVDSIKEAASEESYSSSFNEASVDSSSLSAPTGKQSTETTVTRSTSEDGDSGGGGGAIDLPIDVDFQHCTEEVQGDPDTCSFTQSISAFTTVQEVRASI